MGEFRRTRTAAVPAAGPRGCAEVSAHTRSKAAVGSAATVPAGTGPGPRSNGGPVKTTPAGSAGSPRPRPRPRGAEEFQRSTALRSTRCVGWTTGDPSRSAGSSNRVVDLIGFQP